MSSPSFSTIAIVSCGTLSLELNHLKTEGFLDTPQIYYTTPGLHQDIPEMEKVIKTNEVSNHLPWIADAAHWKESDYWATPLETITTLRPLEVRPSLVVPRIPPSGAMTEGFAA